MASKFGHERLNRQEKVWKEPSGCSGSLEQSLPFEWTPEEGVRYTRVAFEDQKEREFRAFLMEKLKARFPDNIFTVKFPPNFGRSYKFAFGMNARSFSMINRSGSFDKIRARVATMLPIHKAYKHDEIGNYVLECSCNLDALAKKFGFSKINST